jgi:hypothetical protein
MHQKTKSKYKTDNIRELEGKLAYKWAQGSAKRTKTTFFSLKPITANPD